MSSNIKITVAVIFLAAISAGSMYLYFHFKEEIFTLIKEAEALYSAGDLYGAHDKAAEALRKDPLNRKAINLKGSLYVEVQNDTNYKKALESYQLGLAAFGRQNYNEARESFLSARAYIDNVSATATQYHDAQILDKEILARYDEIDDKLTEYYYNSALTVYKRGDFANAFEQLRQAPKKNPQIEDLQSDITYNLGIARYREIMSAASALPATYYNDAVYWLSQVGPSSSKYIEAQEAIKTLTGNRPNN